MRTLAADLDAMAELGAPRISVVGLDPDPGRGFDQFAELAELAAERSIATVTGRRRKPGDTHTTTRV
jgi:hypothetical protein